MPYLLISQGIISYYSDVYFFGQSHWIQKIDRYTSRYIFILLLKIYKFNKLDYLIIGNCILDKSNQDPNLKKDYTKEFELD